MHIVIDEEHMRMILTYLIMVPFASCAALRLAGIAAQWLCSDLHIFRQRSRLSWLSIAFIELLVVLLALLLFGLSSGLVHILAPLSVIIGILSGWSVRSMRMIGICAFTGLCLVVPSLLSRCVVVQLEADTATWDHPPQYRGAHVQLSMMSSSSRLSPPPHLFMYYDDMRFDLYLDSFSGRPTRRKDAAFQPPVAAADGDSDSKQQQQPGVRGLAQHPEQHVLVSVGQRTAIAGFAPSTSSSVSRVVIAGDGSTVSNTALHCAVHNSKEKEDDNDSDSDEGTNSDGNTTKRGVLHASPCFAAAASVQMKNVTFNFVDASTSSSFHAPSLHIDTARSCQDAAERYEVHRLRLSTEGVQLPSGLIRCRKKHMSGGGSSSGDLNAFLTEVSVPQSFYDGIPLSLAWRWYLPDYTRRAQEALQVILDEVLAPGATLFMRYANIAYVFTAELCEYAVERTHAGMPYVVAFMRRSGSVALGALCGDHGEWLSLCTTTHRDEQSYRLGVDIHKALLSFIYTLQETLELVPGAWAAVGWCWRMEWLLVRWIVQFCYSCVAWLAAVVPILEPVYVWRVLCTLGRYLLVSAYFLSTVAAEVLSSFWKMGPVRWVVMEEVREIGLEMDLLQAMAHSTWGFLVLLARELWLLCTVSFACCSLGLSYYSRLSLSIHLTMVLLQTALLVVAVRNEIRDELLNAAQQTEEEESRANNANQGRSFFNPRALFQRFRRNAVVTKLNGIALFVKAHSYTSLQYFIQHGVLLIVLVGLSVLPFSNKLYKLVLHVVLPWISSQCFLSFFHGLRPPPYAEVFALCVVKALVGIALQNTIGDFLYRFLWDLAIIVGVFAAIVLAMWAWPRRVVLARQVAEAVSDSLRQTPMRGSPSGSRAASVPMTPMNEGLHGHVQQTPTGGEEGVGAVLFAAAPPAGGVEADT